MYQFKCLETERKKTEVEIMRLYPTCKLSNNNNNNQNQNQQVPRLPANPSRVDRFIVDLFREYTKVRVITHTLRAFKIYTNVFLNIDFNSFIKN